MINIPYGYCHCGCGEKTGIASRSRTRDNQVKGQPNKYRVGHHRRGATGTTCPLKWHLFLDTHRIDGSGCWTWLRSKDKDGYAFMQGNTKAVRKAGTARAARAYYEHFREPIPKGLQVDHLCHNKICVNPWHLEVVAPAINTQRRLNGKLDAHKVQEMRELREQGANLKDIAARHGVSNSTVCDIMKGRTWRNV